MAQKEVYYKEYLQLHKILGAQAPESDINKVEAHDEMLFIIIHQAYELWFKQINYELDSILKLLSHPSIDDNQPHLQTVVHRTNRIIQILHLLVDQINVLETMTPLDFLDFRDMLRPASGFQSYQWKQIEAKLGLKFEDRFGKQYYLSHLRKDDIEAVQKTENEKSLLQLVNEWLERMPFLDDPKYWENDEAVRNHMNHPFWKEYRNNYSSSLSDIESANLNLFDTLFMEGDYPEGRKLSRKANRAALFIMLYRGYPMLYLPFTLLNALLDVDELMATWRTRHINMVHRMIGKRVGTGNSSGRDYLKAAMDKHYIFTEFAELNSFLIERRNLPKLPTTLTTKLGYSS